MKVRELPAWRDPFLIAAFGGWGDASSVATTSASFLLQKREVVTLIDFDPEEHFVFSDTRPHVRLRDGGQRRLQWPSLTLVSGKGEPRDVAVLLGPEPQLKWRTFAREVAQFWREQGQGGPAVLLGAFLAGVSHAAPVVMTGFATTPALRERLGELGIQPSSYEGPTGVHSALAAAFETEGVPCVSIWAAAPHYLSAMPNPKACAGLLRAVDRLLGLGLDLHDMDEAAAEFEKQVGLALAKAGQKLAQSPEPKAETSEEQTSAEPVEPLPPTDELVKGVEEFLRQRRSE